MTGWSLPQSIDIGGTVYPINTDYRDVLEIIGYLNDESRPEALRWRIAVGLFYEGDIPPQHMEQAMQELSKFISEGEEPDGRPHPKLMDWEQDRKEIIADVNRVSGVEIRAVEYMHWWTFLSFFRGIGEGQLSTLVSIRKKLREHKRLDKWEQDFYRDNRASVDFRKKYTQEEQEERDRLNALLNNRGGKNDP